MSVQELREMLSNIPEDVEIKVRHELIGDEHYVVNVEYDGEHRVLWIRETYY